jgi:hypothetical protein
MNRREVFYIWIRLSPKDAIPQKGPKIIKLYYEDNSHPSSESFISSLRNRIFNTQFLFTIPGFNDEYIKDEGKKYDTFYIVTLPENNVIKYKINNKEKRTSKIERSGALVKEGFDTTDISDGLHVNTYRHSISISLPPLEEQIRFNIIYYVAPDANERHFFGIAIFLLLGISVLVALAGLKVFDYESYDALAFLKPIERYFNPLLGGIVTISLAIIGLFRNPFMDRTRFWFLIPIAISSLAFLLQGFCPHCHTIQPP